MARKKSHPRRIHLLHGEAELPETVLGVVERVVEVEGEPLGVVGTLKVPEKRKEPVVLRTREVLELLQERGLAHPAGAEEPDTVPRSVENLGDLRRTAVELLPSDP